MNLLYLLASLAGVGLMVGLNVLLMRGQLPALDSARATARLAAEIPGFRAGASVVAGDGAVLCENAADGALYLAIAKGDVIVTRKLERGCKCTRDGATIAVRLPDFTFPEAALTFADEASTANWEARVAHAAG